MKDIIYQEVEAPSHNVKVGILMYTGSGDPAIHLKEAVHDYVGKKGYNEFIDANMDNPWVRVIIKGINEMEQVEFDPQRHHL
jgi:hypothetical protein